MSRNVTQNSKKGKFIPHQKREWVTQDSKKGNFSADRLIPAGIMKIYKNVKDRGLFSLFGQVFYI